MTPIQLSATLDVLNAALGFNAPADAVVSRHFRENKNLGPKDRAVVAETVFGVLRHLPQLDWLAGGDAGSKLPSTRDLLLAFFTRIKHLNLRELPGVFGDNDKERAAGMKGMSLRDAPLHVRAALPQWAIDALLASGKTEDEVLALGQSMLQAAPLDLRVNGIKAKRDAVAAELKAAGDINTTPTPFSPWGLRVEGKPAINKYKAFMEGRVEVQDEGSQLLGLLCGAKRGQMVADFCAGAGGKTLLLGAMMQNTGRLYAFDISEKRLSNLKPRLSRSGLSNVHPQLISSETDQKIKRLAGKMDVVLVDAPCSGMGTLRRNPDLKARQTAEGVLELNAKQSSILKSAARMVKAGGRLVYATCSFLPSENEAIVAQFLANHTDFQLLDAREVLKKERVEIELANEYLQLTPQQHHTDAFFAAVMTRVVPTAVVAPAEETPAAE
ncbi:RsmB/NOP family class I SAM-dependent RNA methyltransferase [Deefgea salmonis]|uniref:RsmB/NOP family class I SAM-dependent RNA methyltransferase n=1 Tax=Deefgea salmonis TaxID=2875502 RepID=A0ABS8BK48_9NEIS|nr:RsmB/NOP family class I SAM-dependent RNA methyltransferase [Deefgea salmonis]MCB5196097.1 RsmB/NOP family class I SAM-dependent RNA methyltransferase [Deefgea salmonis]